MKFSGKGPAIHDVLAGAVDDDGKLYEVFNDMAADWPWPADGSKIPKVGQLCSSCASVFVSDEMVYLTIETISWVCWRHIQGLTGPARQEPEK